MVKEWESTHHRTVYKTSRRPWEIDIRDCTIDLVWLKGNADESA